MAQKDGLEAKAIVTRMSSDAVSRAIDENLALGSKLSVQGTPTFVIANQMVRGYMPLSGMKQNVAQARKD